MEASGVTSFSLGSGRSGSHPAPVPTLGVGANVSCPPGFVPYPHLSGSVTGVE